MALVRNKTVSFNMEVPEERDLLIWCEARNNFSGYIKELALRDKYNSLPRTKRKKTGAKENPED